MNIRLLRKVQKQIKEEPRRLDMENWAVYYSQKAIKKMDSTLDSAYHQIPPCGTVGCISGWAQILSGAKPANVARQQFSTGRKKGMEVLGLSFEEAGRLFYVENWPGQFKRPFNKAYWDWENTKTRAEITVARIDHFIKTKGRE